MKNIFNFLLNASECFFFVLNSGKDDFLFYPSQPHNALLFWNHHESSLGSGFKQLFLSLNPEPREHD